MARIKARSAVFGILVLDSDGIRADEGDREGGGVEL